MNFGQNIILNNIHYLLLFFRKNWFSDSSQSTPPFLFSSFSSIGSSSNDSFTDTATSFRETTQTTSNPTPGQWQQLLLLRKVASCFAPLSATVKLHAERELTVHVLQLIYNIILYTCFKQKKQKIPEKNLKILWKKLWFSKIFFYQFCIISCCTFILKNTNPVLKYPVFSEIFQKKFKHSQKEKKYFVAYGQILKFFQAYFSYKKRKQKLHIFHV